MTESGKELLETFDELNRPLSLAELQANFSNHIQLQHGIDELIMMNYIEEKQLFKYNITSFGRNHLRNVRRKAMMPLSIRIKPTTPKNISWFDNIVIRWAAIITIILGIIALLQMAFKVFW